jgi:nickel-dependent lactate racemase
VINHNAYDEESMAVVRPGQGGRGPLMMNRAYAEADRRILVGFIEPHFMAGFSGGYKAAFPGVADLASIMYYHRAEIIGHPQSKWGVLEGNPTQEQIRANASALPVDFLVNVTLNHTRQITRFFCGDVIAAHEEGCRYVKETAMAPVDRRFPLVITTNSGFPLDQNLYQSVKGMCAAAEIIEDDGEMIVAARCNDGFPAHGNFTKLLYEHSSPQAMLETIFRPGFHMLDQWQVQKFAEVAQRAQVAIYSELEPDAVARAGLTPVADLNEHIRAAVANLGDDAPVAVLPEGPMTIPYLV